MTDYPERWFKAELVGSFFGLLLGYYLDSAYDLSVYLGMGLFHCLVCLLKVTGVYKVWSVYGVLYSGRITELNL